MAIEANHEQRCEVVLKGDDIQTLRDALKKLNNPIGYTKVQLETKEQQVLTDLAEAINDKPKH